MRRSLHFAGLAVVLALGAAMAVDAQQSQFSVIQRTVGVDADGNPIYDPEHDAVDSGAPVKIGGYASTTEPTAVSAGDRVNAWFNLRGALQAAPTASEGGGCTWGTPQISTAAVLEYEVKATSGQVYGASGYSLDATPVYLKFYNLTAANTDENDTPVAVFMVPSAATASLGGGNNIPIPAVGVYHSTAITIRATTGLAHNDTGALSANEVVINVCFK